MILKSSTNGIIEMLVIPTSNHWKAVIGTNEKATWSAGTNATAIINNKRTIKLRLKNLFSNNVVTWEISEDGRLNDGFRNVEKLFQLEVYDFFENINKNIKTVCNTSFHDIWEKTMHMIKYPELGFTHFGVVKKFIDEFKPDVVIGTGGYICGPVFAAANARNIPTFLYHEYGQTAPNISSCSDTR